MLKSHSQWVHFQKLNLYRLNSYISILYLHNNSSERPIPVRPSAKVGLKAGTQINSRRILHLLGTFPPIIMESTKKCLYLSTTVVPCGMSTVRREVLTIQPLLRQHFTLLENTLNRWILFNCTRT